MFNALNKWSTKKASITWGFYLGDVRLWRFLFPHLTGYGGLFFVKRRHLLYWFYFTTILHFAAPLTAMKIPSAGASTWPVAEVATS